MPIRREPLIVRTPAHEDEAAVDEAFHAVVEAAVVFVEDQGGGNVWRTTEDGRRLIGAVKAYKYAVQIKLGRR